MTDWETMGEELLGEDVLGEDDATVGAALKRAIRIPKLAQGRMLRLPPQAGWRPRIAPGVAVPGEGLEPLPLAPQANGGVFTAAFPNINFEGRPQAPFRGERLLVSVTRTAGAAAVRALCSGIFVGRALQQAELNNFDIEFFGPTAFGVRLKFVQAEPGVLIRLPILASIAVPAGESMTVTMMLLGHTVR